MDKFIEIFGLKISNISYNDLMNTISAALSDKRKLLVSYANANTINMCFNSIEFKDLLSSIFLVHPDGIGIYFASKFLFPRRGFKNRFSGSDFYLVLAEYLSDLNLRTYFFGNVIETLRKIELCNPKLNISGFNEGYNFDSAQLVSEINRLNPDILIIGLGQPLQEKWIKDNYETIKTYVIIAVGDGIKVFAGEKRRGPVVLHKIGLEWLVRLFFEPFRYFKRYVIGIPIFLCRIIWIKLGNL